ncbi:iron-sulfur cluster assembly accessory protein [bacterium]|nr:iron-sulfur cluster assembly accessory protein [bacterium]
MESTSETAVPESGAPESGEGFIPTDERPIHFTEAAVSAVREAIKAEGEEGDALRVSVMGGGCSGYQYNLDFEKETRMGDVSIPFGDVTIIIDSVSAGLLKGTVVDFVSGLNGTGFKFENPNANRTCGCGSSFG